MIHICTRFDEPGREFCSNEDFIAISFLQSTTDKRFAFPIVIWIGGVDVVYAVVNRISEHRCRLFFIYIALFLDGQAHTSESKNREIGWHPFHPSIEHRSTSTFLIDMRIYSYKLQRLGGFSITFQNLNENT